ncbi:putative permease [Cutibacterium acnes HL099PA1]|uniref:GNAT family N-acetyltransferase n=2 Tax=Cutibacterium acnes TaxID=1747 RepID=UPI00020630FF|nr:GNAT family N-acetyltransferase [Cutibacterium acnes]EGF74527.1 putative permease [Cutibacterium acnes HL099PA1]
MSLIRASWEFSWSWHRSEITEIMAGRIRTAPLVPIAAGVEAMIIWALGGWIISGNWPGWSELAMIGAATLVVVAVIMVATEARRWRAAAWRSWQITPDWRGGAYVSPPTRRHGHMLMCVHAAPRNQGYGSQILTQVCQWADEQGLTLELKPSGSAAERFYKRFGFVKASRRVMRRECLSGGADPHKGV